MGTGGYRFGAGRPGWHLKAEHCRRIDVRRWHREGIVQPGRAGGWLWTDAETGERRASIGYASEPGGVRLSFAVDSAPMVQWVPILHTSCTYGGSRPWFGCPQCKRRVGVLFLASGRFRCRHCARVAYNSQSLDAMGRAWVKQYKAEAKLNPDGSKPARMHWATYERLQGVIDDCEARRDAALVSVCMRLMPHLFR